MSHRLFQKISLKADSCLLFWNQQTDKHQLSPCHSYLRRGNNHFHTIIIIHARIEVPVEETELTNNSDTCKNAVKCSSWFGFFSFPFLLLLYYLSCLLRTSGVFGVDVNFKGNYRLVASSKVYRNNIHLSVFFFRAWHILASKTNRHLNINCVANICLSFPFSFIYIQGSSALAHEGALLTPSRSLDLPATW